ncbi:hypothetical protein [Novosphingobium soli]|uniref:Gfo/Idh/MocA-like oxidoreductase N-terminal domain-containing protein n=1 Tax=Novosphingobium soli TaxID=574956 RepID=A0ABV6CXQ8_9SPHN
MAVNVAVIGLGKMGTSHLAIANALSQLNVTAICGAFGDLVRFCGSFVPGTFAIYGLDSRGKPPLTAGARTLC